MAVYTSVVKKVRPQLGALTRKGVAGEALNVGEWVQLNADSEWIKAQGDSAANASGLIGYVVAGTRRESDGSIIEGEYIDVVYFGPVTGYENLDPLDTYYLDSGTAGKITNVKPSVSRPVGNAESADVLFVNPTTIATY